MADRVSLFKLLGLPDSFGGVLLILSLILFLSPYFSGMDFGIFKIPTFTPVAKKWLRIIGPVLLITCILSFVPILPLIDDVKKPAPTSSPRPESTPAPAPLAEIFPKVDDGEEFFFINKDKSDALRKQFVVDEACRHSGPYGLKLTHRFTGPGNGGWGVSWRKASTGQFDASEFKNFTFWVKGTSGKEKFQIGLKDSRGKEIKVESETFAVVGSNWIMVVIPLDKFRGVNTGSVENINVGFNSTHGSGSICIDDIAFTR